MADFFPALPQPFNVTHPEQGNWASALQRGIEGGQNIYGKSIANDQAQLALDTALETRQAVKAYEPGGDTTQMYKTAPDLAMKIENHLQTLDDKTLDQTLKKMGAATTVADKALPYLMSAPLDKLPGMWGALHQDLVGAGINPSVLPPPNADAATIQKSLRGIYDYSIGIKTAAANVAARAGIDRALIGERGRVTAANISANKPTAGVGRFINYNDYEKDYLTNNPGATRQEAWTQFNKDKAIGPAQAKAEAPPSAAPTPDPYTQTIAFFKDDIDYQLMPEGPDKRKVFREQFEEIKGLNRSVAPRPGAPTAPASTPSGPPIKNLKFGVNSTLRNGTVWTLDQYGQAKQVK